jgi:hypothetical protein
MSHGLRFLFFAHYFFAFFSCFLLVCCPRFKYTLPQCHKGLLFFSFLLVARVNALSLQQVVDGDVGVRLFSYDSVNLVGDALLNLYRLQKLSSSLSQPNVPLLELVFGIPHLLSQYPFLSGDVLKSIASVKRSEESYSHSSSRSTVLPPNSSSSSRSHSQSSRSHGHGGH